MNISSDSPSDRKSLVSAMNLSLGIGLLMFAIKGGLPAHRVVLRF